MSFLDVLFKKKEEPCEIPLCENPKDDKHKWPFCTSCMVNSVRRFMYTEGTLKAQDAERAKYWINYFCENWESMVEKEKKIIDERGADYNRNTFNDDEEPHDIDADLRTKDQTDPK